MLSEEWNDRLDQVHSPPHDEAIQVFFVIVVPSVNQHLSNPKKLSQFVQANNALRTLRHRKFMGNLIAGSVAFSTHPIGLSDKADGEASFSVYKTNNPAKLNQPFLLIVRTQHIVTTFRLVVWDTRVFQHIAEC